MALLHVLTAAPQNAPDADGLLRALRRALPRTPDGRVLLLFCDLPDAPARSMPEDDALIRRLQSGVMSLESRRPGEVLLLVRRRAWDAALRRFLGRDQAMSARQVLAQLLFDGQTDARFEAVSFSPGAIKGRFDSILLCDAAHFCTIDTPPRMAAQLKAHPCVYAPVRCMPQDEAPLLAHLLNQGFSFAPGYPVLPTAYTPEALLGHTDCVQAEGCMFASSEPPDVRRLLHQAYLSALRGPVRPALLPVLQVLALLACAALGWPYPALAALIFPEARALFHPSKLPGALLRAALLPVRAAIALDAQLRRWFAGKRVYIALPRAAMRPGICVPFGLALLTLAFYGTHAMAQVLPLSLFWLFAPLIVRSLHLPGSERIPLDEGERAVLRTDAQAQLLSPSAAGRDPGLSMLCACSACMLGVLEPDEAARRADSMRQRLAGWLKSSECSALSRAAVLACAQFLREHMGDCDAAMRALPAQLEAMIAAAPLPAQSSLLARLLRAGMQGDSAPLSEDSPRADSAADALFLPLRLLALTETALPTLPLTHPHTYAKRRGLPPGHAGALREPVESAQSELLALCLVSSALDHPFRALLLRSPVIAPAAAGLVFA